MIYYCNTNRFYSENIDILKSMHNSYHENNIVNRIVRQKAIHFVLSSFTFLLIFVSSNCMLSNILLEFYFDDLFFNKISEKYIFYYAYLFLYYSCRNLQQCFDNIFKFILNVFLNFGINNFFPLSIFNNKLSMIITINIQIIFVEIF